MQRIKTTPAAAASNPILTRPEDAWTLVGPSVRAAAESLRHAHPRCRIVAVDRFGDVDTRAVSDDWFRPGESGIVEGRSVRVGGIPSLTDSSHLDVVHGDDPPAPLVRSWCDAVGLGYPEFRNRPPMDHWDDWIYRRHDTSGGTGVFKAAGLEPHRVGPGEWRRVIEGEPVGITFGINPTGLQIVGVTRSLVRDHGRRPYCYAGSVHDPNIESAVQRWSDPMQRLARLVHDWREPMGCFGMDAIWTGEDLLILEINRRYTASMELHERRLGWCALTGAAAPVRDGGSSKRILYADVDSRFELQRWRLNHPGDSIHDYPPDGTLVAAGDPVCTLLQ